jgi:hypothetical protein
MDKPGRHLRNYFFAGLAGSGAGAGAGVGAGAAGAGAGAGVVTAGCGAGWGTSDFFSQPISMVAIPMTKARMNADIFFKNAHLLPKV